MVSGLKWVVPTYLTDTSIEPLADDPVLTKGSLIYIDPAHSTNPMTAAPSSTPGATVKVPNIAWKQAAIQIGSGTATTLSSDLIMGSSTDVASFKMAITSKGGIQGIMSQTNNSANSQGAYIKAADPIRDYLFSHPNDDMYIGLTVLRNRAAINASTGNKRSAIFGNSAANSDANSLFSLNSAAVYPSSGDLGKSLSAAGLNGLGRLDFDLAVTAFGGTVPSTAAQYLALAALWGSAHPTGFGGTVKNEHSSFVLYLFHLENLTVSGQSYAQAKARLDARRAALFGIGGRYYGDTPIDPATFL